MRNVRTYAPGSPRMVGITKARALITNQEGTRLFWDNADSPSTKWALVHFIKVQLTAILGRDALVGTGPLPDWLRRKRGLIALDTFNDSLCQFRCIDIHHPSFNARNIAIRWLEYKSQQRGVRIHHAKCGHGGERCI